MKKYLYSLLGAIIGGVICNVIFFTIGKLAIAFDLRLFDSEEEALRNFVIFLVLFLIFVITGGVKGFFVGKK